jgi:arsenate reductase
MKKVLVLCTGNSCRSQMAEAYLRYFAKDKAQIWSAGVETHGVNKTAIAMMQEDGIDIASHTSNHIDEYQGIDFDFVITVCDNAQERCPYFPNQAKKIHQNFEDPSKVIGSEQEVLLAFRKVRQNIKNFCKQFVEEHL